MPAKLLFDEWQKILLMYLGTILCGLMILCKLLKIYSDGIINFFYQLYLLLPARVQAIHI